MNTEIASDTHARLKCTRCVGGKEKIEPPSSADTNSDMSNWYHAERDVRKLPDQLVRAIAAESGAISFVFHQKSHEQAKQNPMPVIEEKEEEEEEKYESPKVNDGDGDDDWII